MWGRRTVGSNRVERELQCAAPTREERYYKFCVEMVTLNRQRTSGFAAVIACVEQHYFHCLC